MSSVLTTEEARKIEQLAKDLGDMYKLLNCGSFVMSDAIENAQALMMFTPAMEKVYESFDELDTSKPETSEAAYQAIMGAAIHMQVIAQGIHSKKIQMHWGAQL